MIIPNNYNMIIPNIYLKWQRVIVTVFENAVKMQLGECVCI